MRSLLVPAIVVMLALLAAPARAHDYWLEFQPLAPSTGGELALSLWVGEDFAPHEQKAIEPARTLVFRHVSSGRDDDLLPTIREGAKPLHRLALAEPGGHLLALERSPARIELRARKFNRYLKHEGLLPALAERKRSGERLHRGRERYTRYLKAFVQVGAGADGVSTRVLAHRLELAPERDLATLRPGDRLGVVVRFAGAPLPGVLVEAFVRDARGAPQGQAATTDANGRVEFTVGRAGAWLLRTVHMQRGIGCEGVDWESFWAAYSFAVN